jgi:transposase
MPNKRITMSKLRQLLRLYDQGESKKRIGVLCGLSRNTVKKYLNRLEELGLSIKETEKMSDHELDALFGEGVMPEPSERYKHLQSKFADIEKKLKKKGVTREQIWQQYIQQYPDGYQLSQFKHHYRRWLKYSKPTMHIEHKVGDKLYIDFAGQKLHVADKDTGEHREVEVFVAILGASQLTYVEAIESQKKEDLIQCCINALEYIQGVPRAIVPDNLKSAVTKSDRYEPTLNIAFENFAHHYSTAILPARAYKPKDKSLAEGAVKISYRRIYAKLHDRVFHSLKDLNEAIRQALEVHNNTKLTARPYSRRQLFEEIERNELQPLPERRYEFKKHQMATVSLTGHVCLNEDKHYYSVPYVHIGKKIKILYSKSQIEIYHRYVLIATHDRDKAPYKYTTTPDHMASTHKYLTEWNPERFINWASKIDDTVRVFIIKILESKAHPEQAYKTCQGVLNYERRVGRKRLIAACTRALYYQKYTYQIIKNILEKRLDQLEEDTQEQLVETPKHENIRGEEYYQ